MKNPATLSLATLILRSSIACSSQTGTITTVTPAMTRSTRAGAISRTAPPCERTPSHIFSNAGSDSPCATSGVKRATTAASRRLTTSLTTSIASFSADPWARPDGPAIPTPSAAKIGMAITSLVSRRFLVASLIAPPSFFACTFVIELQTGSVKLMHLGGSDDVFVMAGHAVGCDLGALFQSAHAVKAMIAKVSRNPVRLRGTTPTGRTPMTSHISRKDFLYSAAGLGVGVAMPAIWRSDRAFAQGAVTLKLGHPDTPLHPTQTVATKFSEMVAHKTGGAIRIQVF